KLDKSQPVFVYCAVGGRSGRSAQTLQQLGFTQVYDLEGGITRWQQEGLPVEKP
ncbi:MAG: rhodanese-like domain-containing protein, partial [Bacteroidetes bacterium]